MQEPDDVLSFWLEELTPQDWYRGGDDLDARIRDRFQDTWTAARAGKLDRWETTPRGSLAFILLTDQLPRNMFRGSGQSFDTDALARAASKRAIERRWDLKIPEPARQFVYMPLMHSESLVDQDRCVRMFLTRMPETGGSNLLHARAHREVIRRFGRFPYRNEALKRPTFRDERAYLEGGGYGSTVEALKAAA